MNQLGMPSSSVASALPEEREPRTFSRSRSPRREDDESSLLAHIAPREPLFRPQQLHPPLPDEPAEIHDLPVDPPGDDDSDDGSSSASSVSSHDETQAFIVFRLRMSSVHVRLRTETQAVTLWDLQRNLYLNPHELQVVHRIVHAPEDLRIAQTTPLLVQMTYDFGSGDDRRLVLVDIDFHDHHPLPKVTKRFVTRLHRQISHQSLLEHLGLGDYCERVRQQCIPWINGVRISPFSTALYEVHHAMYIQVAVPPLEGSTIKTCHLVRSSLEGFAPGEAAILEHLFDTDDDWPVDRPEHDANAFLQASSARLQATSSSRTTLLLDNLVPAAPQVPVDFSFVNIVKFELLNMPMHLLEEWPDDLQFPMHTVEAFNQLKRPMWTQPTALHFFVDGSKVRGHSVGAGIAAFIENSDGWSFAGCMARHVPSADHAFLGEHAAMIWSLLWALQFSEWMEKAFGSHSLDIHFNYDATNTGNQAAGWWRSHSHIPWQHLMRSLAHILEGRYSARHIHWHHVKAHSDHPWNDLVDVLAKYASVHPDLVHACDPWIHWLHDQRQLNLIQWIWYIEKMQHCSLQAAPLHGQMLSHHIQLDLSDPVATDTQNVTLPTSTSNITFDLTFATANVLTLGSSEAGVCALTTRQHILMQQFDALGCHVIGLQETRHRHLVARSNDFYHVLGHSATAAGQDGVQIWVTKTRPFYRHGPLVTSNNLTIVDSSPTHLIVKLHMRTWRCLLITGRAPHSGHGAAHAEHFCNGISNHIRQLARQWPVFFMGDTNGHLGREPSAAVGNVHPSIENISGVAFHHWLLEHGLWLPATFDGCHSGSIHNTFVSPDGNHESRIDYIAVPDNIEFDAVRSWVTEDVDLSLQRLDHLPVLCAFSFTTTVPESADWRCKNFEKRLDDRHFSQAMTSPTNFHCFSEMIQMPPWSVDPHQTADILASQTRQAVRAFACTSRPWRRKRHLSDEVWHLVDEKKALFRQLRSLRRTQRSTDLRYLFLAWRATLQHHCAAVPDLGSWNVLHDHAVATTMHRRRHVSLQVTAAVRAEDSVYYQSLAEEAGRTYTVEGLTAIWQKLRAVLPKQRVRHAVQRHDLGPALLQHFEQLEAGTTTSGSEARQQCLTRNRDEMRERDPCTLIDIEELPTLVEIEDLCLRLRPNKAPGPDGLSSNVCRYGAAALAPHLHGALLKSFLSGIEPHRYKGGYLVSIWKQKGSQRDPASYRGILLSESFGKVYHAWLRRRLLPTLQNSKALGQLGGLPSQQTVSGIQLLRLHGRIGRAKRLSTAVIFVDLRSAFHHLLREYVFTNRHPLGLDELARVFDAMDFDFACPCSRPSRSHANTSL